RAGVAGATCNKDRGSRHAVVDVEDPPPALEPLPVLPAVAGATAVVDVADAEPAAGPELDLEAEGRRGGGGGTAVREHHQRWPLALGGGEVGVVRLVEQRVGGHRLAVERAGELD